MADDEIVQQLQHELRQEKSKYEMLEHQVAEAEEVEMQLKEELRSIHRRAEEKAREEEARWQRELNAVFSDLSEERDAKSTLATRVVNLERELAEERAFRSTPMDASIVTASNLEMEREMADLKEYVADSQMRREKLENEVHSLSRSLAETTEQLEDCTRDCNNVRRELGEARSQIMCLESEITEMKNSGQFAQQGCSTLLGEFVDERRNLEKDLKTLYAENNALRKDNTRLQRKVREAIAMRSMAVSIDPRDVKPDCRCFRNHLEVHAIQAELDQWQRKYNNAVLSFTEALEKKGTHPSLSAGKIEQILTEQRTYGERLEQKAKEANDAKASEKRATEDMKWLEKQLRVAEESLRNHKLTIAQLTEVPENSEVPPDSLFIMHVPTKQQIDASKDTASSSVTAPKTAAPPTVASSASDSSFLTGSTTKAEAARQEEITPMKASIPNPFGKMYSSSSSSMASTSLRAPPSSARAVSFAPDVPTSTTARRPTRTRGGARPRLVLTKMIEAPPKPQPARKPQESDVSEKKEDTASKGDAKVVEEDEKKEEEDVPPKRARIDEGTDENLAPVGTLNMTLGMGKERHAGDANLEETAMETTRME